MIVRVLAIKHTIFVGLFTFYKELIPKVFNNSFKICFISHINIS